ncbi:MAG: hypothetical protein WKF55_13440 [Gemmatimonadaceae bacterium]
MTQRFNKVLISAIGILAFSGCSNAESTAPSSRDRQPLTSIATTEVDTSLNAILKGVALALRTTSVRQQLLADLRDTPFPRHKIHLQSYLRGARGAAIVEAAALGLAVTPQHLLMQLAALPTLEFSMSRSIDRVRWTGTDDVLVVGSVSTLHDILRTGRLAGYNTRGEPITVPVMGAFEPAPQLHVLKAQSDFGSDPERARSQAPRRMGSTISTRNEEFFTVQNDCGPEAVIECPTEGTGAGGFVATGYQLDPAFSWDNCVTNSTGPDRDMDQIKDDCEHAVALTFRPYLKVMSNDNNLSREPHWSVTRSFEFPRTFRIFYALAYREDGGSPAFGQGGSHNGDSEFIIVEVREESAARYQMTRGTLSAHDGECCGVDGTGTWTSADFQFRSGEGRGRPIVWVAEDKHANYKTENQCDKGANWLDNCDNPASGYQTSEVRSDDNIGNLANFMLDCVPSRDPYRGDYDPNLLECFITTLHKFVGWRELDGGAAAAYITKLSNWGF